MVHCSCPLYDLFVVVSGRDGRSSNYLRSRASDRSDYHETSIMGSKDNKKRGIWQEFIYKRTSTFEPEKYVPKNMSLKCKGKRLNMYFAVTSYLVKLELPAALNQ